MKKIIFVSLFIFLTASDNFSQSIYDGKEEFFSPFYDIYSKNFLSVKAAGKGYTGIAGDNDLSGTILNPASLIQSNQFEIYGEYNFKSNADYFNSFGYQSENSHSEIEELNPIMLAGISYKVNKDMEMAALYENNNGFRIKSLVTNEKGVFTGEYFYQNVSISSVLLPVVYTGLKSFRFGINLRYSFYSYKTEPDDFFYIKESFGKFIPDFGVIYKPLNNLTFGATFTPQTSENVEGENKDTSFYYTDPNYFPMKLGLGVSYSILKTSLTLSLDYTYINSSSADNQRLTDRNDFNFGIEYGINKNIIVRTGIFYINDFRDPYNRGSILTIQYNEKNFSQLFGTLGATVNINKFNLNLSVVDSKLFSTGDLTQTQIDFGVGYGF